MYRLFCVVLKQPMAQNTQHILMVRPVAFEANRQTAVNNAFQQSGNHNEAQHPALAEFNGLVHLLRENGVSPLVVEDTADPHTPDSIFPNNWFSTHEEGTVALYPMFAGNRRAERRTDIIEMLSRQFLVSTVTDFSASEKEGRFLEGTGSMVLDRDLRICYACLSPRTDKKLLQAFCNAFGYELLAFQACDAGGNAVYHTNVMMSVGDCFLAVCLEAMSNPTERDLLVQSTSKELIRLSMEQMHHFAGNMLEVVNRKGEHLLVMSSRAYASLTPGQVTRFEKYARILHTDLSTIESNGGGSARCMMAEIFLPEK